MTETNSHPLEDDEQLAALLDETLAENGVVEPALLLHRQVRPTRHQNPGKDANAVLGRGTALAEDFHPFHAAAR